MENNERPKKPEIKKAYHSCFLTDVQIAEDEIRILDSYRNPYYIKLSDKESLASFKSWFKKVFLKGIAQSVSVFEYRLEHREECEVGTYIVKFFNVSEEVEPEEKPEKQLLTESV